MLFCLTKAPNDEPMTKCVFLDRDGVINKDYVDYVYSADRLEILSGVPEALQNLKAAGFLLIVITNQSGIVKGVYSQEAMHATHQLIQDACNHAITDFFYAPGHPSYSETMARKPGSLMFERAIARYKVAPANSWMVGDRDRDLIPARQLGMQTIQVDHQDSATAHHKAENLLAASEIILKAQ